MRCEWQINAGMKASRNRHGHQLANGGPPPDILCGSTLHDQLSGGCCKGMMLLLCPCAINVGFHVLFDCHLLPSWTYRIPGLTLHLDSVQGYCTPLLPYVPHDWQAAFGIHVRDNCQVARRSTFELASANRKPMNLILGTM